jgi:type I restriction enzyme M protein
MLTSLGEDALNQTVREIFRFPTTVFNHDENLRQIIKGIDQLNWHEANNDGLGRIYEGLLERSASEVRSGAGQYFTPRALVDCIVGLLKPAPGEYVEDPAAGTGGFLISSCEYIVSKHGAADLARATSRFQAIELEGDTYRLCLMNFYLHGITGTVLHGDALAGDGQHLHAPNVLMANPPFGSASGGGRTRHHRISHATSNKQLLFVQHICSRLPEGGRAAVIVPDNVLFESGVGRKVRQDLLEIYDLHTILRLPTGIFSATNVNTSVLFFNRPSRGKPATTATWVYDLRTGIGRFKRSAPLTRDVFRDFERAYGDDPSGHAARKEANDGRYRCFSRVQIAELGDNLDLRWLQDQGEAAYPEDSADDLLRSIMDLLNQAMSEVSLIASELGASSDD